MKKLLLVITILCIQTSFSQEQRKIFIEEGSWGLGGRFSLTNNSNESEYYNSRSSTETLSMLLAPNVGYTFADNWFLGLSFMYTYDKQESSSSSDMESSSHGVGLAPNIRKYFPISEKFAFSLQGSLEYVRRKTETTSSYSDSRVEKSYCVAIRPGFSYFLGNKFALEAKTGMLSYSGLNADLNDNNVAEGNSFVLDFGLSSIQFGAIYFF